MSKGVAVVIVASTRAATGVYEDRTGPVIASWLAERGFTVRGPEVVSDGSAVAGALRAAVATAPAVIISTGGTGLSPSDSTPESTAPLLDRHVPGLMEEIRRRGGVKTPTALLTRGLAGVAGPTFILNLPGSTGGVLDGLEVLDTVLDHLLEQIPGVQSH